MAEIMPLMMMGASMAMAPKAPKPPTPQPPPPMPDPEGPEVKAARRRQMEAAAASKGRASTNLTGNAPTAAPTFVNSTLGS